MQPIKLKIEGDYFDSQIYSGLLYLWDFNGSVHTIDFNKLVLSLISKEEDFLATYCAFLDGRYLYNAGIQNLLRDKEFKKVLLDKINRLSGMTLEISKRKLSYYKIDTQDLPGKIIHIDSEVYSNKIYIANDNGLFNFSIRSNTKYPISTVGNKLWDQRIISIKASEYPQFALSAGSEGLFELNKSRLRYTNLKQVELKHPIFEVSKEHSNYSDYNSLSLFSTSFVGGSALFRFNWEEKDLDSKKKVGGKVLSEKLSAEKIFGVNGKSISWGSGGKLYCLNENQIAVARYQKRSETYNEIEPFIIKNSEFSSDSLFSVIGKPNLGMNAFFGIVIEGEKGLLVIRSDNLRSEIKGPISRWRVFPRSKNYENHLHVIKDDCIEVYSFYHDFINQEAEKFYGLDSELMGLFISDEYYDSAFEHFKSNKKL